jgi:hypothetical protein
MDWLALERKVDRVVGNAFGESVRLSFLKNGTVDPSRSAVDIVAQLHVGGDNSASLEGGRGDGYRSRLAAGMGELFLDRSRYTGPMPRAGDKVRANARAGQPWFEVSMVGDHDTNIIVVSLTRG